MRLIKPKGFSYFLFSLSEPIRVARRDHAREMRFNFTGLLQIGETSARMKNHRVDELHVCVESNEGASWDVYESLEVALSGIC